LLENILVTFERRNMLKNNLYNHSAACTNNLVLTILQSEAVLSISKCSTLTNAEREMKNVFFFGKLTYVLKEEMMMKNVMKRKQSVWRREVDKMGSVGRRDEEIKWVEV
jgi:hypothetical protein